MSFPRARQYQLEPQMSTMCFTQFRYQSRGWRLEGHVIEPLKHSCTTGLPLWFYIFYLKISPGEPIPTKSSGNDSDLSWFIYGNLSEISFFNDLSQFKIWNSWDIFPTPTISYHPYRGRNWFTQLWDRAWSLCSNRSQLPSSCSLAAWDIDLPWAYSGL